MTNQLAGPTEIVVMPTTGHNDGPHDAFRARSNAWLEAMVQGNTSLDTARNGQRDDSCGTGYPDPITTGLNKDGTYGTSIVTGITCRSKSSEELLICWK